MLVRVPYMVACYLTHRILSDSWHQLRSSLPAYLPRFTDFSLRWTKSDARYRLMSSTWSRNCAFRGEVTPFPRRRAGFSAGRNSRLIDDRVPVDSAIECAMCRLIHMPREGVVESHPRAVAINRPRRRVGGRAPSGDIEPIPCGSGT